MRIDPIGPADLPISLAIVREHLRIEQGADDALVILYTRGAVAEVEKATRRVISRQRFRLVAEPATVVTLPIYPVASVDSVESETGPLDAADYDLRADLLPQEIHISGAVSGSLRIEVTAGHEPDDLPPDLAAAILLTVGHRYENRESVITGTIATPLPLAIDRLCWANRVGL